MFKKLKAAAERRDKAKAEAELEQRITEMLKQYSWIMSLESPISDDKAKEN